MQNYCRYNSTKMKVELQFLFSAHPPSLIRDLCCPHGANIPLVTVHAHIEDSGQTVQLLCLI